MTDILSSSPAPKEEGSSELKKSLLLYGGIMAVFALLSTMHVEGESYGVLSILPVILILFTAIKTRKALEGIFAGIVAGLLLLDPSSVFSRLGEISTKVMMDETIAWIILVCGMMGGLINMLERGGSVLSFGDFLAGRIKTKRGTLLTTCLLITSHQETVVGALILHPLLTGSRSASHPIKRSNRQHHFFYYHASALI